MRVIGIINKDVIENIRPRLTPYSNETNIKEINKKAFKYIIPYSIEKYSPTIQPSNRP